MSSKLAKTREDLYIAEREVCLLYQLLMSPPVGLVPQSVHASLTRWYQRRDKLQRRLQRLSE